MDAPPRLSQADKRTLGLSSLGGALEFYDFVIYVFYAKLISVIQITKKSALEGAKIGL